MSIFLVCIITYSIVSFGFCIFVIKADRDPLSLRPELLKCEPVGESFTEHFLLVVCQHIRLPLVSDADPDLTHGFFHTDCDMRILLIQRIHSLFKHCLDQKAQHVASLVRYSVFLCDHGYIAGCARQQPFVIRYSKLDHIPSSYGKHSSLIASDSTTKKCIKKHPGAAAPGS